MRIEGFDLGVDAKVFKASLKGSLRQNPTFRSKLQEHMRGLVSELHQEFLSFVLELVAWIRQHRAHRRGLVFVLDGVDHVRGLSAERETVQRSIETLFGHFSEMLKLPGMHAVYTVLSYLPLLNPSLRDLYGVTPGWRRRPRCIASLVKRGDWQRATAALEA